MRKGTWSHGITGYQRYKCRCEICVNAGKATRQRYRPYSDNSKVRLDGHVLIDRLIKDERFFDRNMAARIVKQGLSVYSADMYAVRFGYHPFEVWGFDFYEGINDESNVVI